MGIWARLARCIAEARERAELRRRKPVPLAPRHAIDGAPATLVVLRPGGAPAVRGEGNLMSPVLGPASERGRTLGEALWEMSYGRRFGAP